MQTSAHTIVFSAPQATGKSLRAAEIAVALGCTQVVDDWNGQDPLPTGALALTNADSIALPDGAVQLTAQDAEGVARIAMALKRQAA